MKKKAIFLLLTIVMVVSTVPVALASNEDVPVPIASDYLDDYSANLVANGDGVMAIETSINGVGIQDKIGVRRVDIEQKVDGQWEYYDTLDAADHPEFYAYSSRSFVKTIYFDGTAGIAYRVTIMAYAKKGSGSDTGYVTSRSCTCK